MEFSSSGNLQFSTLGITQTLTGLTLSTTIYDTASGPTGATIVSSIVPTGLNYILGSALDETFVGSGFNVFTRGVLSLTTNSSRIVEITMTSTGTTLGRVQVSSTEFQAVAADVRCIRGPSTLIGDLRFGSQETGNANPYSFSLPCSTFKFTDLSPPSGAATYILLGNPGGASNQISATGAKMFVRQI